MGTRQVLLLVYIWLYTRMQERLEKTLQGRAAQQYQKYMLEVK